MQCGDNIKVLYFIFIGTKRSDMKLGWIKNKKLPNKFQQHLSPIRHGNNALGFRRHRIQIPYGSSIRVFDTNPEFRLEGIIVEPATPLADPAWAGARKYYSFTLW